MLGLFGFLMQDCEGVRVRQLHPREPLAVDSHLSPVYLRRREMALSAFDEWLLTELGIDLDQLAASGPLLGQGLLAYGHYLHDTGYPYYLYSHAITGAQASYREHKPFLGASWHFATQWSLAEQARWLSKPADC